MISSYFVLEAVIPRQVNCASACINQTLGFAGENGGNSQGVLLARRQQQDALHSMSVGGR